MCGKGLPTVDQTALLDRQLGVEEEAAQAEENEGWSNQARECRTACLVILVRSSRGMPSTEAA